MVEDEPAVPVAAGVAEDDGKQRRKEAKLRPSPPAR
jgi:hypothetical protein